MIGPADLLRLLPLWLLAAPAERVLAQTTLTVDAAASLTEPFRELGRILEERHPGLTVRFNFAGSQQLALQIEQGAPADVFASADQRWMRFLGDKGLVDGPRTAFARNRLVVIVPKANPAGIARLQDLARPGVKLVLAADAVPAGRYAREALRNLAAAREFAAGYERRVLANVVSEEENVKSVAAKVQLGEADAGIVYGSDVTPTVASRVRVIEIPARHDPIATYPIAVLKSATRPELAREFVALVSSGRGQAVLRRHRLLPAPATSPAGAEAHP